MKSIDAIHQDRLRRDLPPFRAGDTVRVHVRIREGDKERIQVFEGVVIQRRGGGHGETFTVRKVSSGVGVERIFPVQSPTVTRLEIKSRGHVRRARLFYLRELTGKKARLRSKVRDVSALMAEVEEAGTAEAAAVAEEAKAAEAAAEAEEAARPEEAPAAEDAPAEEPAAEEPTPEPEEEEKKD